MTFADYIINIPAAGNNPSDDQPNMEQNTNAIPQVLAINHHAFNDPSGGRHTQVEMTNYASIPTGLTINEGTIYTKQAPNLSAGNESDIFYTPDMSGKEYQLTRTDTANYSKFGLFTNYVSPSTTFGGWTFLPGGLIMQYGIIVPAGTVTTVAFPVTFPIAVWSIQVTTVTTSGSNYGANVFSSSPSSFQASTGSSSATNLYWVAIGK